MTLLQKQIDEDCLSRDIDALRMEFYRGNHAVSGCHIEGSHSWRFSELTFEEFCQAFFRRACAQMGLQFKKP